MKTYMAKGETVERKWYVVDANGMVLGRLASQVAAILRGKHKPIYTPHVDTGDHVIIINADKVVMTGKKLDQKKYYRHTGYPLSLIHIFAQLKHKGARKPIQAKFYGYGDKKTEIHTEEESRAVVEASSGVPFIVQDIKVGERHRHAPPPFTTSSLQQEASRKLGFTTKLTMLLAQQLYEGVEIAGQGVTGLITYIRTDSVRIAEEAQNQAREYIETTYGKQYVPAKPNVYKGRKGAQDAHEAIRPANLESRPEDVKASLNNNQYKLYKLIFERFLASQMAEAQYEASTVTFHAGKCTYKASGSRTLFNGYTAVYLSLIHI